MLTFSQDHVLVLIYNVTKYICLLAAFKIKAHLLGRQYMVIFHIAKRFSVCTYLARRLGCVLFILFFIYTESVTLFTAVGVLFVTFMHPPHLSHVQYILYIYIYIESWLITGSPVISSAFFSTPLSCYTWLQIQWAAKFRSLLNLESLLARRHTNTNTNTNKRTARTLS